MSGIWLLGVAVTISLFLIVNFFSKTNYESREVRVYKYLIILNLLFSTNALVTYIIAKTIGTVEIIGFMQKIHLELLLLISSLFFVYMIVINNMNKKYDNLLINISKVVCLSLMCLIFIIPVKVINKKEILDVGGYSYYVAITGVVIYFILVILLNIRYFIINKNVKKQVPFIVLTILFLIGFILRIYFPEVITETYCTTFVFLIMYFTIENPDIKMLKQMELAKNEAEKANNAKTEFLSSMSHEIRTPLNAVIGFSECIKESNNIEEIHQDASDIIKASNTLLEIINGIFDISKIESGNVEIKDTDYNPRKLFNDIAKLITPKMNEKGLDFTVNIANDIPKVLYGDPLNIKKVVTNLLSNAVKYTQTGYVKYDVRCINSNNVSRLIISVEDSGKGIKEKDISKLFVKFQRVDEDRNTTIEGTGLGLAIAKQLIELMNGKIIVQSVYGSGSKFTIILDQLIEKKQVVENKKTDIKKTDFSLKRVLIVDDNKLNLKVASKLLEKYNLNIDTCETGIDAISKISDNNSYDLIFLDDMMPKMSGVETFNRLRKINRITTPIVVLTANAITGEKERYLEIGFDDYLAKPINKEELDKIVKKYLTISSKYVNFEKLPEEVYEVGAKSELIIK